jgi:diaminohydroxyphosphoribosylaminopyrimidine deaminase/5-amino-6-(5-phosphoribosylamino)uracil reductase
MVDALMRRALRLAARGRGQTSPNPMVGATVIAPDGTIVGDGWHRAAGTPHAEVHALTQARSQAAGATLICTLEPCNHHGRTGPCTERIVAAGIGHVIAATEDPNPRVAGSGFRRLSEHGIRVTVGVEAELAARLNAPFFTVMRAGRPWVVMKAGVSVDGSVAAADGQRTAITSPASQLRVQRMRAEMDAVAVGVGTVLVDDPVLTVRELYRGRPFPRIVFDRELRTPPSARLFGTLAAGPVVIMTTQASVEAFPARASALTAAGAQLEITDGTVADGLRRLASLGIHALILEGGPTLQRAAWDAGMIDEVRLFIASAPLGPTGVPLWTGGGFSLAALQNTRTTVIGPDVLVSGYVHRPH